MNEIVVASRGRNVQVVQAESSEFVTFYIGDQMFGVPVLRVQDILQPEQIARIPLAPPEVAGSINLRGRIVTVIDVRARLGLPPMATDDDEPPMALTVENGPDLYSLLIDRVGDVISLPISDFEQTPTNMDHIWRSYSDGVYRLKGNLMVVLDVDSFLDIGPGANPFGA
ncbi:chemotaxis protein CheW [Magnetospira sp. QH-2]|uniref:chemotaxis protein CheW n=1 Tax=Magnetospira sp. (strain QH-2) TaxID=1288970 RepID=UPI0003E813DF|nr:chemotaxis protein CheW [Magnetospira sp. QH-2]CCQ73852.1 Chemotaxis protein CheW [Magnetospira sp. QH-2]